MRIMKTLSRPAKPGRLGVATQGGSGPTGPTSQPIPANRDFDQMTPQVPTQPMDRTDGPGSALRQARSPARPVYTLLSRRKSVYVRNGQGGSPGSPGNPPCCFGRLCAEAVELAVPNATDERVPFFWREAENSASSIPAVPDANLAAGQARHLNAVTVRETQRAFHPFGLILERRHSVATLH